MMALKAYAVLEKDEYTGDIYFAPRAIVAAKAGANEYGDGELSYIQCRRAPWADAFARKGVPAKVAVDHGWHFECHGCGIQIDSDLEEEHRLPVDGIVGTMDSRENFTATLKALKAAGVKFPLGSVTADGNFMRIELALRNVREHSENTVLGRRRILDIAVAPTIGPAAFAAFFDDALDELPSVKINMGDEAPDAAPVCKRSCIVT